MSKFLEQLGYCTLICQTIEFRLFSVISSGQIKRILSDPESNFDGIAAEFTKNWNVTKKKLLAQFEGLNESRLDDYIVRRNWVIHNVIFDGISKSGNMYDQDLQGHVDFFEECDEYFGQLLEIDEPKESIVGEERLQALVDSYLSNIAKAVVKSKSPTSRVEP